MIDQYFLLCTIVVWLTNSHLHNEERLTRYTLHTPNQSWVSLPLPGLPLTTVRASIAVTIHTHLSTNQSQIITLCRDADRFLIPLTRIGSGGNGHKLCISSTLTFTSISCLVPRTDHMSGGGTTCPPSDFLSRSGF